MKYSPTYPLVLDVPASTALDYALSIIAKFRNAPISFHDPVIDELLTCERWALRRLFEAYSLDHYGPLSVCTVRQFFEDFDNRSTNACDRF